MEFEIGGDLVRPQQRFAPRDRIDIDAAAGHGLAEGASAGAMGQGQGRGGQPADKGQRARIGLAVPGTLLPAQGQDPQGRRQSGPAAQAVEHQQAGDDPGETVEIAALRHRIEVRADHDRRL